LSSRRWSHWGPQVRALQGQPTGVPRGSSIRVPPVEYGNTQGDVAQEKRQADMIPKNTIDLEAVERANEELFEREVEEMENSIFDETNEWRRWKTHDCGAVYKTAGFTTEFTVGRDKNGDPIKRPVSDEQWERIVRDIKDAGYCVYKEWYHNGYYGYTKVLSYCITKAPLTPTQRLAMHLQDEWSRASGPGREQKRGERL